MSNFSCKIDTIVILEHAFLFFLYFPFSRQMIQMQNFLIMTIFASYIALAAASSPLGVIGGALAGHGIATLVNYFT